MEEVVNVRLPRALWDIIQARAARERRSATAELAVILTRALATDKEEPPKTRAAVVQFNP